MEVKESIKVIFAGSKQQGEMVSEFVWAIIENYHKAEKEFFNFLADLESKTPDEIGELPLPDFIDLIKELFSEKNFPFFKSATALVAQKSTT
jgi:hypothetical protein